MRVLSQKTSYKGLDDIIAMAGPEDEVLVYLAGHGLQGFYSSYG